MKNGFQTTGKFVQACLFFDDSEPAIAFAARDLESVLSEGEMTVHMKSLADLPPNTSGICVVLATQAPQILKNLEAAGGTVSKTLGEQDYVLRVTVSGNDKTIWAIGGDRTGTMYGGIHLAEIAKAFGLEAVKDEDQSPYIAVSSRMLGNARLINSLQMQMCPSFSMNVSSGIAVCRWMASALCLSRR